jgi:hypothetical protein
LQGGASGIAGIGAVTIRYFPQPAFGAELALGGGDAFGFTSTLMAHVRYPMTTFAVGIAAGLSMSVGGAQITCESTTSNMCPAERTRDVPVTTLMVPVALTGELRLGSRFTLRAMLGVRVVANPADLRAMDDRTRYGLCSNTSGARMGLSPCDVYLENNGGSTVAPLVGIDLGYGF